MISSCAKGRRRPALSSSWQLDRKSTRLNSSHQIISYAVFCLKKKQSNSSDDSVRVMTNKACTEPLHIRDVTPAQDTLSPHSPTEPLSFTPAHHLPTLHSTVST